MLSVARMPRIPNIQNIINIDPIHLYINKETNIGKLNKSKYFQCCSTHLYLDYFSERNLAL